MQQLSVVTLYTCHVCSRAHSSKNTYCICNSSSHIIIVQSPKHTLEGNKFVRVYILCYEVRVREFDSMVHTFHTHTCIASHTATFPGPPLPVFNHLQYITTEGQGLGDPVMCDVREIGSIHWGRCQATFCSIDVAL